MAARPRDYARFVLAFLLLLVANGCSTHIVQPKAPSPPDPWNFEPLVPPDVEVRHLVEDEPLDDEDRWLRKELQRPMVDEPIVESVRDAEDIDNCVPDEWDDCYTPPPCSDDCAPWAWEWIT